MIRAPVVVRDESSGIGCCSGSECDCRLPVCK